MNVGQEKDATLSRVEHHQSVRGDSNPQHKLESQARGVLKSFWPSGLAVVFEMKIVTHVRYIGFWSRFTDLIIFRYYYYYYYYYYYVIDSACLI
jgi:hypothetical protein